MTMTTFTNFVFLTSDEIIKISVMANTVEYPNHDPNLYRFSIDVSSCTAKVVDSAIEEKFKNKR